MHGWPDLKGPAGRLRPLLFPQPQHEDDRGDLLNSIVDAMRITTVCHVCHDGPCDLDTHLVELDLLNTDDVIGGKDKVLG